MVAHVIAVPRFFLRVSTSGLGIYCASCGLMESPPRLGLGTILGPLDQSLTYMGQHTRLWV